MSEAVSVSLVGKVNRNQFEQGALNIRADPTRCSWADRLEYINGPDDGDCAVKFPSKSPAAIVGLLQRYLEKTKAEICEYEVMKVNDKPVCEYDLSALFSPSLGESVEILIDKKEGNRLVVLLPRDDRRSYNLAPLHALLSALVVGASTPDALLGQDQLRLHMGSVWQDHLDKAKRALDQPIVDAARLSVPR